MGLAEASRTATGSSGERIDALVERLSHPVVVAHALSLLGLGDNPEDAAVDLDSQFSETLRNLDDLLRPLDEDDARANDLVVRAWGAGIEKAVARANVESLRENLKNTQSQLEADPTLVVAALARQLESDPVFTAKVLAHSGALRNHREATAVGNNKSAEPRSAQSATADFGLCVVCTMIQAFADIACHNTHGTCLRDAENVDETTIPEDAGPDAREEIIQLRIELAKERCDDMLSRCLEGNANKAKVCCLIASAIPL